jgi:hypothetical protein
MWHGVNVNNNIVLILTEAVSLLKSDRNTGLILN